MKKILFILLSVLSLSIEAQTSCTASAKSYVDAYIVPNGTRAISGLKMNTALNKIITAINCNDSVRGVDTIFRNSSKDSIVFKIDGTRYAIKDSIGTGTVSSVTMSKNGGGDSIILVVNSTRTAVIDKDAQTLQQAIDRGATLTKNDTILGAGFGLTIKNNRYFSINQTQVAEGDIGVGKVFIGSQSGSDDTAAIIQIGSNSANGTGYSLAGESDGGNAIDIEGTSNSGIGIKYTATSGSSKAFQVVANSTDETAFDIVVSNAGKFGAAFYLNADSVGFQVDATGILYGSAQVGRSTRGEAWSCEGFTEDGIGSSIYGNASDSGNAVLIYGDAGGVGDDLNITLVNEKFEINGLPTAASTDSVLGINGQNKVVKVPAAGGSTPTLDQVLLAGATFSVGHQIDCNGEDLAINDIDYIEYNATTTTPTHNSFQVTADATGVANVSAVQVLAQNNSATVAAMSFTSTNSGTGADIELNAGGGKIVLVTTPPASASDTGIAGQVAFDTNYIYYCVATDTWKRVAISTW